MINWNNIRVWNNTQNNGFEELVCQLAKREKFDRPSIFCKVGNLDGGIECYHQFDNGIRYTWQAKYFNRASDITSNEWNQIFKSFKTALNNWGNITRYYICLPIDLGQPSKGINAQYLQRKEEWQAYAESKGQHVEFEYWGSFELGERLIKPESRGLQYFWFNETEFSENWFHRHTEKAINELDQRYSPELDVDIDDDQYIDALLHTKIFYNKFEKECHTFFDMRQDEINLLEKLEGFESLKSSLIAYHYDVCEQHIFNRELWQSICQECSELIDSAKKFENDYFRSDAKRKDDELYSFWRAEQKLSSLYWFLKSDYLKTAYDKCIFITGEAGSGKSHYITKSVQKSKSESGGAILLLGHNFVSQENPWTQILHNMLKTELDGTPQGTKEFLGALSCYAEAKQKIVLIAIDALNEGKEYKFWKRKIVNFINEIAEYENLALIFSIRDTYIYAMIPENFSSQTQFVRVKHKGFAELSDVAVQKFFSYYNILLPQTPLMNPEFNNPLFLKIFCETLYKLGLRTIPEGSVGLSNIIERYCQAIDKRLTETVRYNYDVRDNVTLQVVKAIAYGCTFSDNLLVDEARKITNKIIDDYEIQKSFLDDLISEGILIRQPNYSEENTTSDLIGFTYNRFEDHFKAMAVCELYKSVQAIQEALQDEKSEISQILFSKDSFVNSDTLGLIESLAIVIPEQYGVEFHDLIPESYRYEYYFVSAFINSLKWRNTKTIQESSREYVWEAINKADNYHAHQHHIAWLNTIFINSGKPLHPFNGHYLHKNLIEMSLPDRDAIWTTQISKKYNDVRSASDLVYWLIHHKNQSNLCSESVLSTALAISWLLTSTNRNLRDRATKALIGLYAHHVAELPRLLKLFENVNDPYVYERLYAVVYGSVVHANNTNGFAELAHYIYSTIFHCDEVYPHILLRDYARSAIEWIIYQGIDLDIDRKKIRPPYKSSFDANLPSTEWIDGRYDIDWKNIKDDEKHLFSQLDILHSMTTEYGRGVSCYGDFGRYIFQYKVDDWGKAFPDPQLLSNLAVKMIFDELGYDVEKHGKFDIENSSHNRSPQKIERIGKKYQWIAMHNILARLSDNYPKIGQYEDECNEAYQGPWNPFTRDIDPTILYIKQAEDKPSHWSEKLDSKNIKWTDKTPQTWVEDESNLPPFEDSLLFTDYEGVEWIALYNYSSWRMPKAIDAPKYSWDEKEIGYHFTSFIISNNDLNILNHYIEQEQDYNSFNEDLRIRSSHQMFQRELYWSPAYQALSQEFYEGNFTKKITLGDYGNITIMLTCENFIFEGDDYSYQGHTSRLIPTADFCTIFKMKDSKEWGSFEDQNNQTICIDSSCQYNSKSKLLIRKENISKYLLGNKSSLVWYFNGQKSSGNHDLPMQDFEGHFVYDGNHIKSIDIKKSNYGFHE